MKIKRDGKEYRLTSKELYQAHQEFVVNWMADAAQEISTKKISRKRALDVANHAYEIYSEGNGLSEYESVEKAVNEMI